MTSLADPVVRTYEVFVSQALNEQLFVLQHPTRPAHLPFTPDQVLSVRVKPNQNRLQLDYLVPDTDNSARFCPIKAERMATGDEIERERPSHRLTSEPSLLSGNRYAVGVLKDRSLHLNPLESVVQLRPDVSPLDATSKKPEETADETEGDIVPLQMKVARSYFNVERANQRKRDRQNQEESWVPLSYNEFGSGTAGYLRSLLFGDVAEESGGNKPISNEEYLEQLAQVSRQVSRPLAPVAPQSSSLDRQLRNRPIKEQLLHVLKNVVGNCVRFSYVHGLLGNQFSAENLLKGLQQVAMLVQGWFVLMSSELYPLSGDKRTDPLELRRCRDFLLCHYALYKPLDKQDTLRLLALPVEEFNEMFGPISSFFLRGRHSFKYSEDRLFIRDHMELCRQHSSQWTEVFETIQKHYKLDKPRETPPLAPDTSEKKRAKSDSGIDPNSVRQLLGNAPMEFASLKNKVLELYGRVKQENSEISHLLSNAGMFDEVLHTILQEINAAVIEAKNRTIVVARETDCVTDVYRMALISCLEVKPSQRKQDLVSSFKKSIKSVPADFDLNEMILSLCDIKGATCAIKGLNA